jgi:hypothetical protein
MTLNNRLDLNEGAIYKFSGFSGAKSIATVVNILEGYIDETNRQGYWFNLWWGGGIFQED